MAGARSISRELLPIKRNLQLPVGRPHYLIGCPLTPTTYQTPCRPWPVVSPGWVSLAKSYRGHAPYLTMVAPSLRVTVLSWDLSALPEAVGELSMLDAAEPTLLDAAETT